MSQPSPRSSGKQPSTEVRCAPVLRPIVVMTSALAKPILPVFRMRPASRLFNKFMAPIANRFVATRLPRVPFGVGVKRVGKRNGLSCWQVQPKFVARRDRVR